MSALHIEKNIRFYKLCCINMFFIAIFKILMLSIPTKGNGGLEWNICRTCPSQKHLAACSTPPLSIDRNVKRHKCVTAKDGGSKTRRQKQRWLAELTWHAHISVLFFTKELSLVLLNMSLACSMANYSCLQLIFWWNRVNPRKSMLLYCTITILEPNTLLSK